MCKNVKNVNISKTRQLILNELYFGLYYIYVIYVYRYIYMYIYIRIYV